MSLSRAIMWIVILVTLTLGAGAYWFFTREFKGQAAETVNIAHTEALTGSSLGLVGYWTFDGNDIDWGGDPIEIKDTSGNAKHGDAQGSLAAASAIRGQTGQALFFNGTSNLVSLGNVYNGVKTVAFWVKPNTTTQSLIDLNGTATINMTTGTVAANNFTSPTIYVDGTATSTFPDTNWHHVVVTTGTGINASAVNLGKIASSYFGGILDDVRFYSSTLSSTQVTDIYRASSAKEVDNANHREALTNGLVGYWTFDGRDVKWSDVGTEIKDISGNGNHGAVSGLSASSAVRGKLGQALNLNGAGGYISASDSASLSVTSNITVSGWMKMPAGFSGSSDYNQGIVDKGDYRFFLDMSDGKAKWVVNDNVAKAFSALGSTPIVSGSPQIHALIPWMGNLYLAGNFADFGGDENLDNILYWNGTTLGGTSALRLNSRVRALAVYKGNLYAGGNFSNAGGDADADYIAMWNGSTWSWPSGQSLEGGDVNGMGVWNDNLYVGGSFTSINGDSNLHGIAKWDGSSFSWPSGQSFSSGGVTSLVVWNNELYMGGGFTNAGGDAAIDRIAKWTGSSWTNIASNVNDTVWALAIYDGSLYVAGNFANIGGDANADYIGKYSGSSWSALGASPPLSATTYALAVWNGNLYVGGNFTTAGGVSGANYIAKWDGSSWGLVGSASSLNAQVRSLAVWRGDLYVAGDFTNAGGDANADFVAKFGTSSIKEVASNTSSWEANHWYQIIGTYDGGNLRIFVNGSLETTSASTSLALEDSSSNLLLGATHGTQWPYGSWEGFAGSFDDVRIYNRALSTTEVVDLYNLGK